MKALSACLFFYLLALFVPFALGPPKTAAAGKVSSDQWEDLYVEPGKDVEFVLNANDFPNGSNFSQGQTIEFYLGKLGNVDASKANFYALSGVQGFWDLQSYHVNKWKNDYGQDLEGEQILDRHFGMLSSAGVKWVRMDWIWATIAKGDYGNITYDYTIPDTIFSLAKKHNLKILADLVYTPKKLSTCPTCDWWDYAIRPPRDLYQNNCVGSCQGLRSNGSPSFNEFVEMMVKRYRPGGQHPEAGSYGITHWEIWNEPDWSTWKPPSGGKYESYFYLLKGAYQTIDQIRSATGTNLKVVFGGLAIPEDNLQKYYSKIGRNLNNYYDIMSIHRYIRVSSIIRQTRQTLDNNGAQSKKIWLTETDKRNGESTQADWLSSTFMPLWDQRSSLGLEKVFWWASKDYYLISSNFNAYITSGSGPPEAKAGVIRNYYRPKDVYLRWTKEIGSATNWIGGKNGSGEITFDSQYKKSLGSGSTVTFTIPSSHLQNNSEYTLFWAVDKKLSTGKTIKITVTDVTHKECNVSDQCVAVAGSGSDQCQTHADCAPPTHKECDTGQCVSVEGSGTDICSIHTDCKYKKCDTSDRCVTVNTNTPRADLCNDDDDCQPPSPADVDTDGDVDDDDMQLVLDAWGPVSNTTSNRDFDSNGIINCLDAALVIAHWNP
jgi:hypothetical protein